MRTPPLENPQAARRPEREPGQRPSLLLITHDIPYPPYRNGGFRVIYPVLEHLGAEYAIDLLFPRLDGHEPSPEALDEVRRHCRSVITFPCRVNRAKRLLTALFHPLPLVYTLYSRRLFRTEIQPRVAPRVAEYTTVIVQDTHFVPHLERLGLPASCRRILVAVDYYTTVFQRIARNARGLASKIYHWLAYRKLRWAEPRLFQSFDSVVYVSGEDRRRLLSRHPEEEERVQVIPIAVDTVDTDEQRTRVEGLEEDTPTLLFTGNMNYAPNRQAVQWFYEHVFRHLRDIDGLRWLVVGLDAHRVQIDDPGVRIESDVPSIRPYLRRAWLFVAPLRSGGGLKIKVLDAMACSKTVVGSPVAFEGIPIKDGVDGVVADSAGTFRSEIRRLLGDAEGRRRIGCRAAECVERHFAEAIVVQRWRELVDGGAVPEAGVSGSST